MHKVAQHKVAQLKVARLKVARQTLSKETNTSNQIHTKFHEELLKTTQNT